MKLWNKIKIHPLTYFITLISLLTGLFKYLIMIYIIISIHEIGHIIISKIFKRKISSITILPFGGLVKIDSSISTNIFEDLLIAIGGIGIQILLAMTLFLLNIYNIINETLFVTLNHYNILIISFNLLPVCPLDGYKIVKLISELFIPFKKTFLISFIISIFCLFLSIFLKTETFKDNLFVLIFLLYSILEEFKNKTFILIRFYIERMNMEYIFYKKKYVKNKESMFKNRYNIINGQDEKSYLLREYSSKIM